MAVTRPAPASGEPGPPPRAIVRPLARDDAAPPEEADDPLDALLHGTPSLQLRARGERVNASGFEDAATAVTLRTALAYAFRPWRGVGGPDEFESVSAANGDTYDSTVNGRTERPIVADPAGTEVNQVYLERALGEAASLRAGRQLLVLITGPATEVSRWGAKFADSHAQEFGANARKVWLWWETRV